MAIVNDDKKFIFFHLYKCGGMSLRKLLQENITGSIEVLGGHCLPVEMKYYYDFRGKEYEDKFNEMFKFTVVRNPFDFLLSTYHYALAYQNHFMHKAVKKMKYKYFPAYYLKIAEQHKDITIKKFGTNKVVSSLYDWIIDKDGNNIMNFIGKLENIDTDINIILEKIGEPLIEMPKVNININNNKHYQEVYDKKTRAFVEKHFAKDFEFFEYKWEDL